VSQRRLRDHMGVPLASGFFSAFEQLARCRLGLLCCPVTFWCSRGNQKHLSEAFDALLCCGRFFLRLAHSGIGADETLPIDPLAKTGAVIIGCGVAKTPRRFEADYAEAPFAKLFATSRRAPAGMLVAYRAPFLAVVLAVRGFMRDLIESRVPFIYGRAVRLGLVDGF